MSFLYNILPEYTRNTDTTVDYNVTGEVKILEEFLSSVDVEIFDVISDSIREILSFRDINNIKDEYLPYFAYMLGYEWSTQLSLDLQKEILINILDIYKRKGTKFSFHFGLYKIDPTISIYEPYRNIFELNKSYINYGFDIYNRWRYKLTDAKKIITDSSNNMYAINDNILIKLDIDGNKLWEKEFTDSNIIDIDINLVDIKKDNIYILTKNINTNICYLTHINTDGNIIYQTNYNIIKCMCITPDNNIYLAINDNDNDYIIKLDGNTGNVININDDIRYYISNLTYLNINSMLCNENYLYVIGNAFKDDNKSNTIIKIFKHNDDNDTLVELHEYIYSYDYLNDSITNIKYDNNENLYIVINNKKLIRINIEDFSKNIIKNDIDIYYLDICRFKSRNYLLVSTNNSIRILDINNVTELYSIKTITDANFILGNLTNNVLYYIDKDIISKNYYNMIDGDFLTSRDYYSNGVIVVRTKNMSDAVKDIIKMVLPAGWKLLIEGTSGLYYSFHDKTGHKDNEDLFNFLDEYRKKYIDFYINSDILSNFENTETENNKMQYYSGVQYHSRGHMNIVMLGKTFILDTNSSLFSVFNLNLYAESANNLYTGFRNPLHYAQVFNKQSIHETNDNVIHGLYFVLPVPNNVKMIEMLVVGAGGGSSDLIELADGNSISVGGGAGEIIKSVYYINTDNIDPTLSYNHLIVAEAGYGGIINNDGENSIINILHPVTNEILHTVTALGGKCPDTFDNTKTYMSGGFDYDDIGHGSDIYSIAENWSDIYKLITVYNSHNTNGDNTMYLTKDDVANTINTAGSSSYDIGLGFKYSNNKVGSGGCYAVKTLDENLDYIAGKGGNGYIKIIMHY